MESFPPLRCGGNLSIGIIFSENLFWGLTFLSRSKMLYYRVHHFLFVTVTVGLLEQISIKTDIKRYVLLIRPFSECTVYHTFIGGSRPSCIIGITPNPQDTSFFREYVTEMLSQFKLKLVLVHDTLATEIVSGDNVPPAGSYARLFSFCSHESTFSA